MANGIPEVPSDLRPYLQPMAPVQALDINLDPKANSRQKLMQALQQGGVGILAPDGTPGFVHGSAVDQFLKDNPTYKPAVVMSAPDGTPGLVARDEAASFLKANPSYQVGSKVASPEYGSDAWYASKLPEPVVSGLSWFQKHVNDPLNRMSEKGSEFGAEHLPQITPMISPGAAAAKGIISRLSPQLGEIGTGIERGVGGVAGGTIADPRNWPFLAQGPLRGAVRPVLQKLISGGFSAQMAKGTYDSAKDLYENWDNMTPEQRAEAATKAGISAYLTKETGKGALSDFAAPASEVAAKTSAIIKRPVEAVTGYFKPAEKLTVPEAITRGVAPKGKVKAQWRQAVTENPQTMADARRGADNLGVNVETMGPKEALDSVRQAKKDIWNELETNHPGEGSFADTTEVGQRIASTISKRSLEENKGWTKDALARAKRYAGRQLGLGEIEDRLTELNGETDAIEAMMPSNKRAAQMKPENRPIFAERDGLRELLLKRLNETTGPGAKELRKRYGNLKVMESALSRRVEDLASKATSESELWQLGKIRSVGRMVKGTVTAAGSVATGEPLGVALGVGEVASGAKQLRAQRMADLKRNPEFLIRKAFRETSPTPAPNLGGPVRNPVTGFLPPAPILSGPSPEPQYIPPVPPPFDRSTRAQRLGLILNAAPTELGPSNVPEPPMAQPAASRVVRDVKTGKMRKQYLTATKGSEVGMPPHGKPNQEPITRESEMKAEFEFQKKLRAMYPNGVTIHHESPIKNYAGLQKGFVTSEGSIFGTIDQPSNFVSGPKAMVEFRVLPRDYHLLSPDMRYSGYRDFLNQHPNFKGGDISFAGDKVKISKLYKK